ncbi:hypothetical protein ACVIHH_006614 [Bradyrhizobium sp. USDA 4518]
MTEHDDLLQVRKQLAVAELRQDGIERLERARRARRERRLAALPAIEAPAQRLRRQLEGLDVGLDQELRRDAACALSAARK